MGLGLINVDLCVLCVMVSQLVGQYDLVMIYYMNEVMVLYCGVFCIENCWMMLVDGIFCVGIEVILVLVIWLGDKVLVLVFGWFGYLLCEIVCCCWVEVYIIEVLWGEVFILDQVEDVIKCVCLCLLFIVQGDILIIMLQLLVELGEICCCYDVLFYIDVIVLFGGNLLEIDVWQLDVVFVGMQKCLGGFFGILFIIFSLWMEEVICCCCCIEQGICIDVYYDGVDEMIYFNYFDFGMVMDYWGLECFNYYIEVILVLFVVWECVCLIFQEGFDNGIVCYKLYGDVLLKGIQVMGFEIFGDLWYKMNNVLGVVIFNGINGDQVWKLMLEDFGIEIGILFGLLYGKVWCIGIMGYNVCKDCVMQMFSVLEVVLNYFKFIIIQGVVMQVVWDYYCNEVIL